MKKVKPTLIVGNGVANLDLDFTKYRNIVVFNDIRHRQLLPVATAHWCVRSPYEHSARLYLLDHNRSALSAEVLALGDHAYSFVRTSDIIDTYPSGKLPSTGFVALNRYLRQSGEIEMTGFSWEGWEGHAWEYEKEFCRRLVRRGRLKLLN